MALPTKQAPLYGRRAMVNRAMGCSAALFALARLPYKEACFVGKAMAAFADMKHAAQVVLALSFSQRFLF